MLCDADVRYIPDVVALLFELEDHIDRLYLMRPTAIWHATHCDT